MQSLTRCAQLVQTGSVAQPVGLSLAGFAPLARRTVPTRIAEHLRAAILDGRFRPGRVLPSERELAKIFGVTRTTIKHALVELERSGLIHTRHGVGSVVQDPLTAAGLDLLEHLLIRNGRPDLALLQGVFELRIWVGTQIARAAAQRARAEHKHSLRELLGRLRGAPGPAQVQEIDMEFFTVLAEATGNSAVRLLINSVATAYRAHGKWFVGAFSDPKWVAEGLERIRRAVARGDAAGAARWAEKHLARTGERMLRAVAGAQADRRGGQTEETTP